MKSSHPSQEPQLAPPGAGVPFLEKMLMKFYVGPFVSAKAPWEKSQATFSIISDKILKEVDGLSESQLNKKVLVPPQTGLEDSSRYWSVAMTLEHMGIVGRKIYLVVEALTQGQIPSEEADIAKMKPFGKRTAASAIEDFKLYSKAEFSELEKKIGDRNSKLKFKHPWFGPMTAKQWYWLLGTHHVVHLKQIREIKKGLYKS